MAERGRSSSPMTKLILPALVFSRLNFAPARNALMLYQLDISLALDLPIGTIGYIRSMSSLATVLLSFLLVFLSSAIKSKKILQIGLVGYCITPILAFFSHSYKVLLLTYLFYGLGLAFVNPIVFTYAGSLYSPDKRSKVIGWIMAGSSISGLIGTPILGFVATRLGWRISYLIAILPISIFSFVLAALALPDLMDQPKRKQLNHRTSYTKLVLLAILGYSLNTASFQMGQTYGISYLRQLFGFDAQTASIIFSSMALHYTLGSLTYGRIGKPRMTKRIVVVGSFTVGGLCILYTSMGTQWLVILIGLLIYFTRGLSDSACNNYTLSLGEENKSSIMSLNNAAFGVGTLLGSLLGGFILNNFHWGCVGLTLGLLGIISSFILYYD
jgi:predicted MFS family arabinose efflux permease